MSLKAFLAQNAALPANKEIIVSRRFTEDGNPVPFVIRAIDEETNGKIRSECTTTSTFKNQQTRKFDTNRYLAKLCAASVVSPDLANSELQTSYGVVGSEEVLKRMLLPGEYGTLLEAVQEMNGYDAEKFVEVQDEVKNS